MISLLTACLFFLERSVNCVWPLVPEGCGAESSPWHCSDAVADRDRWMSAAPAHADSSECAGSLVAGVCRSWADHRRHGGYPQILEMTLWVRYPSLDNWPGFCPACQTCRPQAPFWAIDGPHHTHHPPTENLSQRANLAQMEACLYRFRWRRARSPDGGYGQCWVVRQTIWGLPRRYAARWPGRR